MRILVYAPPELPIKYWPIIERILDFDRKLLFLKEGDDITLIFSWNTNNQLALELLQWCIMHQHNASYFVSLTPGQGEVPEKLIEKRPDYCLVFTEQEEHVAAMKAAARQHGITLAVFSLKDKDPEEEKEEKENE